MDMDRPQMKPIVWVGASLKDLWDFPDEVQDDVGRALQAAQFGAKPVNAKPLSGFGGAFVLEIVQNFRTDTYRAVYTVQFSDAIYVLHAFQKKSTSGISTPRRELALIKSRLMQAQELFLRRVEAQRRQEP